MDLSLLLSDSKPLEIFKKDKREGELSHAYALFGEDVFATPPGQKPLAPELDDEFGSILSLFNDKK